MHKSVTPVVAVLLAGLICAADLGSKALVVKHLAYGQQIELMRSLNLVHAVNEGAAFGLLATAGGWQRYLFIAIAVLASAFLIHMIRKPAIGSVERLGLAMILGGAVGNLADRTVRMGVVDWIDLYAGVYHWPAFNIADIGITLGAAVLILNELFRASKKVPTSDRA
jgi:signal peptidase II